MSVGVDAAAGRVVGSNNGRAQPSVAGRIVAVILVLASAGLFLGLEAAQRFEAAVADVVIAAVLDTGTRIGSEGNTILVGLGGARAFTLEINVACSVVLLLVPFFLVAAVMLASGRASVVRAVFAVLGGAVLLLVVNMVRLVLIAHLTLQDGLDGFGWAHTVYGSAIVLAGLILVMIAFVAIMAIGRKRAAERR